MWTSRALRLAALILGVLLACMVGPVCAQTPLPGDGRTAWQEQTARLPAAAQAGELLPRRYRLMALDRAIVEEVLAAAEDQRAAQGSARAGQVVLALPVPGGGFQRFAVAASPVLEPALAAQHPEILTYRGQGLDDPGASMRLGLTPSGLHAAILTGAGSVFITPYGNSAEGLYLVYDAANFVAPTAFTCGVQGQLRPPGTEAAALRRELNALAPAVAVGGELRSYRLALAASGEFSVDAAARVGLANPTDAEKRQAAFDALAARVNLVNAVYEREVAIHFDLVAGNDQIIFPDPLGDPYAGDDMGAMLGENQAVVDSIIGAGNYDVGHVLGNAGGGLAYIGVACYPGYKAQGASGAGAAANAYTTMVTAHELGHQFDAMHTFNANSGACAGGTRSAGDSYEPGSGSTIMSYSGLCGAEQNLPGYYSQFHVTSFNAIVTYSRSDTGATCGSSAPTGNSPPSVDAGADRTIPARTPFVLSGTASDPDGDTLRYGWQQVDAGSSLPAPVATGTNTLAQATTDWGSGPIYRVYPLAPDGASREFPARQHVLSGTLALGEIYPATTRSLNFRLFVRDERSSGGGANSDTLRINVIDTGRAFSVTQPGAAAVWPAGRTGTVRWDVAGTDAAPINCGAVDLLLSQDGGATFPRTLAAGVPNDGEQEVRMPAEPPSEAQGARILMRCSGSIFYNISPAFAIGAPQAWGVLAGSVRDGGNRPIGGARVAIEGGEALTVTSAGDGGYRAELAAGVYTLSVTAYGYEPVTASGITVGDSLTTSYDLQMAALPQQIVSGSVHDAGHGYPLYARVSLRDGVSGAEFDRAWSDPLSGRYSVTVYGGIAYSVSVAAFLPGYATAYGDAAAAEFLLAPDAGCRAPGYRQAGGQCTADDGGLLAGATYGPEGAVLPSVRIGGSGQVVTSMVTGDPSLPVAFFSLFLPPGAQAVEAGGSSGGSDLPPLAATAEIMNGGVTWQELNWEPVYADATLKSLGLSSGQLTPPFASGVTSYTAEVPNDVAEVCMLPTSSVPGARLQVNGTTAISGVLSPPVALVVGGNPLAVDVTARNGVTALSYRIAVTRAAAPEPDMRLYLPYTAR